MFLDRLREVVERQPDQVAIEDGDRQVTFQELDLRARALATELAERGVGREDVVALGLRKSADYLIGLLATWYAGAAFLPLDPTLPSPRIQ